MQTLLLSPYVMINEVLKYLKRIENPLPEEAVYYISSFILSASHYKIMETASTFNILSIEENDFDVFINLKRTNDIRYINKLFEAVNNKLMDGGLFIGFAETMEERRRRLLSKYSPIISYPYYFFDFIVKRIFPKTKFTAGIYFLLTRGENRVLSLPEILGRLISCGFTVVSYKEIGNKLFYVVKKSGEPSYDTDPSYGLIFKMRRVGKNGKNIDVYKFRTMHPYSEYLQNYVYANNDLREGGKFKNDFRITKWGKVMRKFWIDELPMIVNLLKGDVKLVGVRPLSSHYLSLYRAELINKRMKYKPGVIPPFYADMPKTLDEIMDSEERYLDQYEKKPFRTDLKYFYHAWYNILFKKARSH